MIVKRDHRVEQSVDGKTLGLSIDAEIAGQEEVRLAGLNGDVVFSDIPGGTYKVLARYDRQARTIRVTSTGIDVDSGASKTLELVLKQAPDQHGLMQIQWREVPASQQI